MTFSKRTMEAHAWKKSGRKKTAFRRFR